MRRAILVLSLLFAGACQSMPTEGRCSPIGFTACSGNDLVTCNAHPSSPDAGVASRYDCTADGLVCVGTTSAACAMASVGLACRVQDHLACSSDDELLRCVWVSEEPAPGFSGDIGVWRVHTACTDDGRVCRSGACVNP